MYLEYLHNNLSFRYKVLDVLFIAFFIVSLLSPAIVLSEEAPPADPPVEETVVDDPPADPPVDTQAVAGDTVIETGDSVTQGEIGNEVNTNVIATNDASTSTTETLDSTVAEGDNASTTPPLLPELDGTESSSTPESLLNGEDGGVASTTIENANEAEVENEAEVVGETGTNGAGGGGGSASIYTGTAFSVANIANVVNTNIINSNGFLLLLNTLFGGTFDLRTLDFSSFYSGTGTGNSCSLEGCDGGDVDFSVANTNAATITNNVIVRSSTGSNTATSTEGSALIDTGDAYAGANIVNVANTNIVNSNYLLVALNNFGDLAGDIILPGKTFFENFFANVGAQNGSIAVENNNEAEVGNEVSVEADTGANTASSTNSGSTIETGTAIAGSSVINNVNTNLFGDSSLLLLFRIHGNWGGNIFGLPEGVSWAETPSGVQLFSESEGGLSELSAEGGASGNGIGPLSVSNDNTALINNNVQVLALTGENRAEGKEGALINTGNAYAGANIINIANTNVVGRNWILAIFNIFGNFSGNISFGQPDLWLGGAVESEGPIGLSSEFDYHFTISNLGDADASNVRLKLNSDRGIFSLLQVDEFIEETNQAVWDLGSILSGETIEVVIPARIARNLPWGTIPFTATASVESFETDGDQSNNEEVLIGSISNQESLPPAEQGARVVLTPHAELAIEKTASATTTIIAPDAVDYTITIVNEGGIAYESLLFDTLINEETGEVIYEEQWELGDILPDEEINITYTVEFNEEIVSGTYTNQAELLAMDWYPSIRYGNILRIPVEGVSVEVEGGVEKKILSAVEKSDASCEAYISSYIRHGEPNNTDDVSRLQEFLRTDEGFTDILITGEYDKTTQNAVRAFQTRHASEILDPWGLKTTTGYVYYTTQRVINELYCGKGAFPLSEKQEKEIAAFKRFVDRFEEESEEPIRSDSVGEADTESTLAQAIKEEETVTAEEVEEEGTQKGGASATAAATMSMPGELFERVVEGLGQLFIGR